MQSATKEILSKNTTPLKSQNPTASKKDTASNINYFTANEDLASFPETEDVCELIKKVGNLIKLSDNWNNNMEAINLLRRMNKHKKALFNTTFDAHFKYIASNYLLCPRSCIVKISLMLLTEIFSDLNSNLNHSKFSDWIEFLMPVVIRKNVLDRNYIQEEAKNVLNAFAQNIHCTEGLSIFLKIVQDKNLKYSLKAYESFLDIIEEIDTEKLKTGIKWEQILKEIIEISKMKKNPYPNRFKSLFSILLKKLGNEFMEKMLSEMLELGDYLYFSKTDMIQFNETAMKLIQEENIKASKSKNKITLQEHIKSIKYSEKVENDLILAQEEQESEAIQENPSQSKKQFEAISSSKASVRNPVMPELVCVSAKKEENIEKSASGSKNIMSAKKEENKTASGNPSAQKERVIDENPLKNYSVKKENNSPAMSSKKENNEERLKEALDVDPLRSSQKSSNKNQENIVN